MLTFLPSQNTLVKIGRYFFIVVLVITGLYLLGEVLFFLLIDYPFNFYEPEVAIEAWQLSRGGTIYNPPAQGPPAGLYAPLYQLTGALLYQFLPNTLTTLRLISICSIAGTAWVGYKLSSDTSRSGLLFIVVLLGMWHPNLAFFDFQAKPDAYAAFWMAASLFSLLRWTQYGQFRWGFTAVATLLFAFLTKQTMVFVAVAAVTALIVHKEFKKTMIVGTGLLLAGLAGWWLLKYITGPSIYFYLFELPGTFKISYAQVIKSGYTLAGNPWFLLALYLMGRNLLKNRWNFRNSLFITALLLALPASALTAAKDGGQSNAYLPFYWLCSLYITTELPLGRLFRLFYSSTKLRKKGFITLLYLLPALLLFTLHLNPAHYISRMQNRIHSGKMYKQLAHELKQANGNLFIPYDNYLALKAGKPVFWSYKSERDLFYTGKQPAKTYRERALDYSNVVTVSIGTYYQPKAFETILKDHNYSYFKSFKMDDAITYTWWKKSN